MSEERYEAKPACDNYWFILRVRDNARIGSILQVGRRFVSYDAAYNSIQVSRSYDDAYKAITGVKP